MHPVAACRRRTRIRQVHGTFQDATVPGAKSVHHPHNEAQHARRTPTRANHRLLCSLALALPFSPVLAQETAPRDGQHDFDFEIGTWRTRLLRLAKPLSGDTIWVEYSGTTVVRKIWDGRANLVELDVAGPAGRTCGS